MVTTILAAEPPHYSSRASLTTHCKLHANYTYDPGEHASRPAASYTQRSGALCKRWGNISAQESLRNKCQQEFRKTCTSLIEAASPGSIEKNAHVCIPFGVDLWPS